MVTTAVQTETSLRTAIEAQVRGYFRDGTPVAKRYGPQFLRLWEATATHVMGGKLVRPILTLQAFDALVGQDDHPERAEVVRLAAAIELLHYSFLLHDDIIDGDIMRRGEPNLIGHLMGDHLAPGDAARHALPADLHWARTGAILMGDILLAQAHQVFARSTVGPDARKRLLDALDHAVVETIAGEHTDVALSHGMAAVELSTITAMTAQKTATYTFELPLRVAAIVAGAPAALEPVLAKASRSLGLAFQLQDDLLSTFGDPAEHGKDPYSDLREGKQTVIMAHARTTAQWPRIESRLASAASDAELAEVTAILEECGARRYVAQMIDTELDAVKRTLTAGAPGTQVPAALQSVVLGMSDRLEGRRK